MYEITMLVFEGFCFYISLGLFGVPCIFLRKRKGKGVSYGSIDKGDMCVLILVTCIFLSPGIFFCMFFTRLFLLCTVCISLVFGLMGKKTGKEEIVNDMIYVYGFAKSSWVLVTNCHSDTGGEAIFTRTGGVLFSFLFLSLLRLSVSHLPCSISVV